LEKLPADTGETVDISKVLAIVTDDGEFLVGAPYLEAAGVQVKVVRHGRGRKIIVFKFKAKKNYRRKQGHRQAFTQVTVESILTDKSLAAPVVEPPAEEPPVEETPTEQGGETIGT